MGYYVVCPLQVVNHRCHGRYPAIHGPPHACRAGLAVAADDRGRVLVHVDGAADAELLAGQAALAGVPVALGEVSVVEAELVSPDGVAQHDPVLVAGTVASARRRHSKAVLRVTPHGSAPHSTGTLWRMSLMKETRVASGLRHRSRTFTVGEVNLLPYDRRRHPGTPAAADPSLRGAACAAPRTLRLGPVGRHSSGEHAHADPPRQCLSSWLF